ncbi:UDP-glucose:undecaprenyl-phosphate glucose-1-phosphate transferase [Thalassocella blandensis]|nr:UDP-glucose:undecaprenyl-phosphate glucose-1-phosphate transferase [Thalassocella blandensis]
MIKRSIDVVAALVGLFLFGPVMAVVAILVFLEDGGPSIFKQQRHGRNRKPFRVYKFRTYYQGSVSKIGKYLRKTGLDELPQFINILKGDMSLVGPRPLTEDDVVRLGWHSSVYDIRWAVTPGVTGLAQIYAGKGKKVSWFYDMQYIQKHSIFLDVKIILLSLLMNVFNKYRVRRWLELLRLRTKARALKARIFEAGIIETRRLEARRSEAGRQCTKYNWMYWQLLFESRSERSLPNIPKMSHYRAFPNSLAKSLAIFQLGESGGGTIVDQVDKSNIRVINANYRKAMSLFVKEEHRHAEILARCVIALGGKLIRHNWTDRLFVFSRRLMGIRLKVMVLLAAEIVGLCYYRLLASKLPSCEIRENLEALVHDEQSHLAFHCEFLRTQTQGKLAKHVFSLSWYAITSLAMLVVFLDHHRAILDLGISPIILLKRWFKHVALANELVVAEEELVGQGRSRMCSNRKRADQLDFIDKTYI